MDRHIKHVYNPRGSASILIMLIMISLITFGLIAMLLSNSDYKMARKNADWSRQQYAVESQAALAEAALDQLLDQVNQTNTHISNKETLFTAVGEGVRTFEMSGYTWLWQAEKHLVTCQLSTEVPGREMRLGFQIRIAPQSEGACLQYDVVEWRLVNR